MILLFQYSRFLWKLQNVPESMRKLSQSRNDAAAEYDTSVRNKKEILPIASSYQTETKFWVFYYIYILLSLLSTVAFFTVSADE